MTRQEAWLLVCERAGGTGLDDDTADAIVHSVMAIFHEEFTKREWEDFIDQEIQKHAAP